ncbi:unnamed protein product [Rotaria socialis]|uniref:TUG ubiquitin-like domain-containing protein n=1 Tax=Rotaria socialis TaxID=392032 RepID=A0A821CY66_9BILA|nr:unnamed protein product [Rotaria socialis]CAF4613284.1 unnamed protein product [Rotaria socialis]
MAKPTITILCPSGHRRKAQMAPNTNLLQVLEDMCTQESLDSSEWGLTQQRKKCDLTIPWRLSGIPTNALLEMYKLEERRPTSDVTVQLQLPDNSRSNGNFKPSINLQDMLDWYRNQPESMVAALDISMSNDDKFHPVCSYMSEEIIGTYALSNTTLREFGLTSGTAVIRYNNRSMNDDDLKKINSRIDEKIARRNRQQQQTTVSASAPSPSPTTTTTYNPPPSIPVTTASLNNTDEYSIFRKPPVFRPTTNPQQQPKTLAETLGINVSFDSKPIFKQPPQTDFSNFKFPEATKGQDLQQNESSDNSQRKRDSKPNDRRVMAYDLTNNSSKSESQTEELPDSFFELTPDDLRSIINTLRQQGTEDNALETRSMRERNQSLRVSSYEYIAIRLVIHSNVVLQGLFHPEEPILHLMEFARTNLTCPQLEQNDFYLYTSPPRVVLSDVKKPLSAYDLVPAAFVYIGHRAISPLVIQLAQHVSIGNIHEANQIVTRHVFNRTKSDNEDDSEVSTTDTNRPAKRNTTTQNIDDKHLRDKMRKFLPGKK